MFTPASRAATFVFLLWAATPGVAAAQSRGHDTAKLVKQGLEGLDTQQFPLALAAFTAAAAIAPDDSSLNVGAGVAAFMLGQHGAAQGWFERALEVSPDNVTAAEWLGELHYRADRVDIAIAVYETALERSPQSSASGGLARRLDGWRRETVLQTTFAEMRAGFVAVRYRPAGDEALATRVLERLGAAYWRVGGILGAYPSQPISVVLYTREEFEAVTRLPSWTAAAYDGRIRLPWGGVQGAGSAPADDAELDRVLTHELVHAVVATLAGRNTPVWLNEGLATLLEPDGSAATEAVLDGGRARPSLARLHGSFFHLDTVEVERAYAVSARAVRHMTALGGTSAIVALLGDLGRGVPFDRAFRSRLAMRYDAFQTELAQR